jgi:hypothetical protein
MARPAKPNRHFDPHFTLKHRKDTEKASGRGTGSGSGTKDRPAPLIVTRFGPDPLGSFVPEPEPVPLPDAFFPVFWPNHTLSRFDSCVAFRLLPPIRAGMMGEPAK